MVFLILVIAIGRVFYIQVFSYKKLNILAESTNITTTSLVVIPNQIKDKEKTTKSLSKIKVHNLNIIKIIDLAIL